MKPAKKQNEICSFFFHCLQYCYRTSQNSNNNNTNTFTITHKKIWERRFKQSSTLESQVTQSKKNKVKGQCRVISTPARQDLFASLRTRHARSAMSLRSLFQD